MDDVAIKKGPLGGQLYEASLQIDHSVDEDRFPRRDEVFRRLNEIGEEQKIIAARNGHVLSEIVLTSERHNDHDVYTITREGFPKDQ